MLCACLVGPWRQCLERLFHICPSLVSLVSETEMGEDLVCLKPDGNPQFAAAVLKRNQEAQHAVIQLPWLVYAWVAWKSNHTLKVHPESAHCHANVWRGNRPSREELLWWPLKFHHKGSGGSSQHGEVRTYKVKSSLYFVHQSTLSSSHSLLPLSLPPSSTITPTRPVCQSLSN